MRKAINHLKKCDPVLAGIIESIGPCRIEFGEPTFASLAEAIVYQQLNGKAALTIFNRFADLAGRPLMPEGILKLTEAEMRSAGLSKQKLSYIRSLAELTARGEVEFHRFPDMSDEKVIETRGGSRHETLLSGDQEWHAKLSERFGVILPQ